jgi:hypothetical protein
MPEKLVNSFMIPDADAVRTQLASFKAAVDKDPNLKQQFVEDPRAILGKYGFPRPVQNDILRSEPALKYQQLEGELCVISCIVSVCGITILP